MKKIILLLVFFYPSVFAQDSTKTIVDSLILKNPAKNEINVDWFAFIFNHDIQFSYERLLKRNQSITITAALNDYIGNDVDISRRKLKSFGIYASYDIYFSNKQHQGLFVSPVVKFQKIHLLYRNNDVILDVYKPFLGFGLKMGGKFVHKKITFTPQISLYRNLFPKNYMSNLEDIREDLKYPDFGLSAKIGYRF